MRKERDDPGKRNQWHSAKDTEIKWQRDKHAPAFGTKGKRRVTQKQRQTQITLRVNKDKLLVCLSGPVLLIFYSFVILNRSWFTNLVGKCKCYPWKFCHSALLFLWIDELTLCFISCFCAAVDGLHARTERQTGMRERDKEEAGRKESRTECRKCQQIRIYRRNYSRSQGSQ